MLHTFLMVWLFLELCKFEALTWKFFFSGWISASDFLGFVSFFKLVDPTGLVQRQGCCAGDPIGPRCWKVLVGSLGPNLNPYHGGCLFKWLPRSGMEDMVWSLLALAMTSCRSSLADSVSLCCYVLVSPSSAWRISIRRAFMQQMILS